MIQFMGRRNQIEFFVRFKADRSLKCLQYDPYVYHVVHRLICLFGFTVDNGGSQPRALNRQRELVIPD